MAKREFLVHIEFLRALAILFIVFTHLPFPQNDPIGLWFFVFMHNGTVLFVFIAGFLFIYLNKTLNYGNYLFKKLKFVILPYLIIAMIVLVVEVIYNLSHGLFAFDLGKVGINLLTGTNIQIQYWFIPMIALFYISAPMFLFLGRSRLGLCLLPFTLILSVITYRPENFMNPFGAYVNFFGIYHLGCVMGCRKDFFDKLLSKNIILFFSAVFSLCCYVLLVLDWPSFQSRNFEQIFHGSFSFNLDQANKIALIFFFYGLSLRLIHKQYPWVKILAETSFGIFFVHLFFMNGMFVLGIGRENFAGNFMVGLLSVGLSVLLVLGLKKLLGQKSRYLIGS